MFAQKSKGTEKQRTGGGMLKIVQSFCSRQPCWAAWLARGAGRASSAGPAAICKAVPKGQIVVNSPWERLLSDDYCGPLVVVIGGVIGLVIDEVDATAAGIFALDCRLGFSLSFIVLPLLLCDLVKGML